METIQIEQTLEERLAAIEASLTRIETMLSPIVAFFEQIKQHPMLSKMLG